MKTLLTLALLGAASWAVQAQTVTRGPYLQFPTQTSMKVKWRTDVATPSRVNWGPSLSGVMDNAVEDLTPTTDHTLNITGLQPYTEYHYAIGDGTTVLAGADADHRFRTMPVAGTVQPVNVWAIGDFGKGNTEQMAVKNAYLNHVGDNMPDTWIWLGDNAYDDGTDDEFQTKVFGTEFGYAEMFRRVPFMPCPGNHDYNSVAPVLSNISPTQHSGPYYDIVDVPTNGELGGVPSGLEAFYSYDIGNVHFMSLNSEIGAVFGGANDWTGVSPFSSFSGSPFTNWLHADLQANTQPWVVAYFHQPPHTDGSHDSDAFWEVYMQAMRENIIPILEEYGVDLVITGHSHVYERSMLIHGLYDTPDAFDAAQHVVDGSSGRMADGTPYRKYTDGPQPNRGTVYVVQGNSGSKDDGAPLQHPVMYFSHGCATCVGSSHIRVNGDTLNLRYLTAEGTVMDDFSIIKGEYPEGVNVQRDPVAAFSVSPNPVRGLAHIDLDLRQDIDATIELIDLNGRLLKGVHSGRLKAGQQRLQFDADALNLANGAFLVRLMSDQVRTVSRLIRTR